MAVQKPSWPAAASSQALAEKVKAAKVLCVGAGGIGCELLKTLVLTGFQHIQVIDMDTIETSNLNRQFLFRKRHVGESKAKVAAEAVKRFRPNASIMAHQGNVKETQYDVDFFRSFSLVLNGLDNLEARRHVNRLCLAAETPLVESGTTGYLGQASVHIKGQTECFECKPKPAPKSFPVCTIRNTPDKPIHCIVWAKELLFQRLFGRADSITDLDEGAAPQDPLKGPAAASSDPSTVEAQKAEAEDPSVFLRQEGEEPETYARRIFRRVYHDDIQRVLSMEELWKTRSRPKALDVDAIVPCTSQRANGLAGGHVPEAGVQPSACRSLGLSDQHKQWSLEENTKVFIESIRLFVEQRSSDIGTAVFDKDDDLAVEFVAAASNLRSLAYGIPTQALFDAKGMAGNIIHAIATTNAVISGFIVIEALKLLAGVPEACKTTFLVQRPVGMRMLVQALATEKPTPSCMVCGTAQLQLQINTTSTTLAQFINKVLKQRLSVHEPSIMCGEFMYEEGEGLEDDEVAENTAHLGKRLEALPGGGITNGSILQVDDQAQHFKVQIVVTHKDDFEEEQCPEGFTLQGAVPEATQAAPEDPSKPGPSAGQHLMPRADSGDLMIVEDGAKQQHVMEAANAQTNGKGKRKAEAPAEEVSGKRQKEMEAAPIELD